MKQAKSPNDVPCGTHYAVIIYKTDSFYVPGDERSRTAPGHGYPEHTETVNSSEHHVTTNFAEWQKFITDLMKQDPKRKDFVAFKVVSVATVEFEAKVKI